MNAVKFNNTVDVDLETSTIDINDLKKNSRTKAIIFVHISGRPGNFKIINLQKKKNKVIEDAAEVLDLPRL